MNIRDLALNPANLSIKITNFLVHNNNDVFADYEIEVRHEQEEDQKVWKLQRGFTEFECLHSLLIKKYDKAPFLPCRVLLPLRAEERKERTRLLETYLNICVRTLEILNSLELRLFLEIEKHLTVYINPLICVKERALDDLVPIAMDFWPTSRLLLIATSADPNPDASALQKVFTSFKGLFGKKQQACGKIYVMRERIKKALDFEVSQFEEFTDAYPTAMDASESLSMVSVGLSTGKIYVYHIDKMLKLTKFAVYDGHKMLTRSLCSLEGSGLLISASDDKSMFSNDLSDEHGYFHEESSFLYPASCLMFVKKLGVLFVGDTAGNMHIYKLSNDYKGRKFNLLITKSISNSKITSFATDAKETFIFVAYANGIVDVLETGQSFQSVPKLVAQWKLGDNVAKIYLSNKTKSFIAIHNKGLMSFCDVQNPNNFYTQIMHTERIADMAVIEQDRMIITIGEDKRLKFFVYEEKLFTDKFPEKQRIKEFIQDEIVSYIVPENNPIDEMRQPAENKIVEQKRPVQTAPPSKQTADDSDDDMVGWDD
jgi:hypothetical protein